MAERPKTPTDVETKVLTLSARRCALCFQLTGSLNHSRGQIAHINRKKTDYRFVNLAYLCLRHHDAYDSKTSQSKGFTPGELRHCRDALYRAIARKAHLKSATTPKNRTDAPKKVLEHDRRLFRGLGVPEDILEECLDDLRRGLIYSHRIVELHKVLRTSGEESRQFLLPVLQDLLNKYVAALRALLAFVGSHFFPIPGTSKVAFEPEMKSASLESSKRYYALLEELGTFATTVRRAYRDYRRAVRLTLLV